MRYLAAATVLLMLALFAGCAGRNGSDRVVTSTGRAPIDEQLQSAGFQKRILPWDNMVLTSEMRFEVRASANGETTPAAQDARARLEARRLGLVDLGRRIGRLPASEPPPGETARPSVVEFAEKRPAVRAAIEKALEENWTEQVGRDKQGQGVVVLQLPLTSVAEAVLAAGGGFSQESDIAQALDARARAQTLAIERARNEMGQEVLTRMGGDKLTIAQWASMFPANRDALIEEIRNARIVRSEAQPREGAGSPTAEDWVVELELDLARLRSAVRADERTYRSEIRRVERAVKAGEVE